MPLSTGGDIELLRARTAQAAARCCASLGDLMRAATQMAAALAELAEQLRETAPDGRYTASRASPEDAGTAHR